MATALHNFEPGAFVFGSSGFGSPDVLQSTNPKPAIRLEKGQSAYVMFDAVDYGSGNLTLDVFWGADAATTGDVMFGGAIGAITPDADSHDPSGKTLATANTVVDSHLGTTAGRVHKATITISNLDSLAAGDHVLLKLSRVDDVSDTLSGDVFVHRIAVSYSNG